MAGSSTLSLLAEQQILSLNLSCPLKRFSTTKLDFPSTFGIVFPQLDPQQCFHFLILDKAGFVGWPLHLEMSSFYSTVIQLDSKEGIPFSLVYFCNSLRVSSNPNLDLCVGDYQRGKLNIHRSLRSWFQHNTLLRIPTDILDK